MTKPTSLVRVTRLRLNAIFPPFLRRKIHLRLKRERDFNSSAMMFLKGNHKITRGHFREMLIVYNEKFSLHEKASVQEIINAIKKNSSTRQVSLQNIEAFAKWITKARSLREADLTARINLINKLGKSVE